MRNAAIWALVTGLSGQYLVVVQPLVIPAATSAPMAAAWVLPAVSGKAGAVSFQFESSGEKRSHLGSGDGLIRTVFGSGAAFSDTRCNECAYGCCVGVAGCVGESWCGSFQFESSGEKRSHLGSGDGLIRTVFGSGAAFSDTRCNECAYSRDVSITGCVRELRRRWWWWRWWRCCWWRCCWWCRRLGCCGCVECFGGDLGCAAGVRVGLVGVGG